MLTLFALPKPFRGHINLIQRNALGSWIRLHPKCQIILFGDEHGTAEIAKEFGIRHISTIARNEFGTPLVNDLFEKAEQLAEHELMCYVNSDIILLNDFMRATDRVRQWRKKFLIIGQCWNLDLKQPLFFIQPEWDENLRLLLKREGEIREIWATDYFIFPREFYRQIPPFALGRAYFDNWLVWKALTQKAAVVDISPSVTVIHQRHDYSHVVGGQDWAHRGEEAIRNVNLAGGLSHRHCILDATHFLHASGLKRNFIRRLRWSTLKIWQKRMRYFILDSTRPMRHRVGLRVDTLDRLKSLFTR
jgi:hypothetical protein